ncbi:ssDNA endodeoxyribonuclease [Chamberlinius hualienensis]
MPLTSQQSTGNDDLTDHEFEAVIGNVKTIIQLLKAIHLNEIANISINANGIKVTVEEAKCVQANSFLQAQLFDSFSIKPTSISFKVNLTMLLECLQIFGSSTNSSFLPSLNLSYAGYGAPLSLRLEEHDMFTECNVKTYEVDDIVFFDFVDANCVCKIIMQSEYLKDTFAELDTSSEYLQIRVSPRPPYFRISTVGSFNSFHFECPKDSEVMEVFQCTRKQTNRYNTVLLKPSIKALAPSQKISIRTDDRGLLCFQFLIKTECGHESFIEYYCLPNVDNE